MKNKTYEKFGKIFALAVLLIYVLPIISAVGFSTSYHDKNLLKIAPGESHDFLIGNFQNIEIKDKKINVTIMEGSDIAQFIGNYDSLNVPAGKYDVPINMKVTIPKETPEGTNYKIILSYSEPNSESGAGMITMTQSKTITIPILVEKTPVAPVSATQVEKPAFDYTWYIIIFVIIVVIAIVAYILLRNKSTSNSK